MSKTKVKNRRMEPNFVSSQLWEIQYVASKFGVKPETVRQIKKEVGKSRHKIYRAIVSLKKGEGTFTNSKGVFRQKLAK